MLLLIAIERGAVETHDFDLCIYNYEKITKRVDIGLETKAMNGNIL